MDAIYLGLSVLLLMLALGLAVASQRLEGKQ
jgi:hypothetical protein